MPQAVIELYRIPLTQPVHVCERLARLLSPDERVRARRYHFERDRLRFTVSRAALRTILGARLGAAPERIQFRYGPNGKPALAGAGADLRFNLSDSGDWSLLGITEGRELGVDIEALRPIPEITSIAERFFAPSEDAWLRSLSLVEQAWAFHRIWTLKESYLKATGAGLSFDTRSFVFDFTARPARLISVESAPAEPERWSFFEVEPVRGLTGAICVEKADWDLRWRDWTP